MLNADYFREKAEQCRELQQAAAARELIEQLEVWVREFEEEAQLAEGIADPAS